MIHEHQHNSQKLGLRVLNKDGTSCGGFKNSLTPGDIITCPDWEPTNECGNGLHFWPWGHGRQGKNFAGDKLWQVVEYEECVPLKGKAKAPWLKVIYTGDEASCMEILLPGLIACSHKNERDKSSNKTINYSSASNTGEYSSSNNTGNDSAASNTGYGSSASNTGFRSSASNTGYGSSASNTGDHSSASNTGHSSSASNTGHSSSASNTGNCSSASNTGRHSSASNTGNNSLAKTTSIRSISANTGMNSKAECGNNSVAVCINGMVKGGENSSLTLGYYKKDGTLTFKTMLTQPNGRLEPNTWYKIKNGKFVKNED